MVVTTGANLVVTTGACVVTMTSGSGSVTGTVVLGLADTGLRLMADSLGRNLFNRRGSLNDLNLSLASGTSSISLFLDWSQKPGKFKSIADWLEIFSLFLHQQQGYPVGED